MVIIEVNKPRKLWWAKTLKREILIMIPLVLLSILGRGDSDIVLWVLKVTTLLLLVNLIFSHDYEYPYRVKVNDEGVEVDYIHLGINLKHKYLYKRLEIISDFYRNQRYTIIRDKVFIYLSLTLSESCGWSNEKQEALIEVLKSKGIDMT